MRDRTWSDGAYMAEFGSARELTDAVRAFSERGYTRLETYSPVPLDSVWVLAYRGSTSQRMKSSRKPSARPEAV